MSNELLIKSLKSEYEYKKAEYESIGLGKIDHLSLVEKVKSLKEMDRIIANLYELELFNNNELEQDLLVKEYHWLSRQYHIVSVQLVGKEVHEKKEIYKADGIDDQQMKVIKRLWPESKYPHGPEFPDLIFKVRADYLVTLAAYLTAKKREEA